tara:strand:+ start:848 stop:1108 length:261 start_codon:yes stop_codon:yes gene_type:complete
MNINQLIVNVKKKITDNLAVEKILVFDETKKHQNHKSHTKGKFHLSIEIDSSELNKMNKIQSSKLIYKIIHYEIKNYIHSVKLKIN